MKLTVKINTDNAAFGDGNSEAEIGRILAGIFKKIQQGDDGGRCMDYNGNKVGRWEIDAED